MICVTLIIGFQAIGLLDVGTHGEQRWDLDLPGYLGLERRSRYMLVPRLKVWYQGDNRLDFLK